MPSSSTSLLCLSRALNTGQRVGYSQFSPEFLKIKTVLSTKKWEVERSFAEERPLDDTSEHRTRRHIADMSAYSGFVDHPFRLALIAALVLTSLGPMSAANFRPS